MEKVSFAEESPFADNFLNVPRFLRRGEQEKQENNKLEKREILEYT